MTVIVEDGTIVENANSYASEAEADTYWTDRGNTTWTALATSVKTMHLIKATDYMEQVYGLLWVGDQATQDQELSWPRENAVSLGFEIDDDEIPERLVKACIELAERSRQGTLLPDVAANDAPIISISKSAGPVSKSTSYAMPAAKHPVFPAVNAILRPLLRSSSGGAIR